MTHTAKYLLEVSLSDDMTQEDFRLGLEHWLQSKKERDYYEVKKITTMKAYRHNHHSAKTAQRGNER